MATRLSQLRVKHLALLNIIDRHGSLRRAATELHLTQPAVTAMLKELEASFNAVLVERTRQGAKLTLYGLATRDRLEVVLNELRAAQQARAISPNANYLRVGALPIAMLDLIPAAVARMRRTGEDITLQFTEGTVKSIIALLLDNNLDCVIGRIEATSPPPQLMQDLSLDLLIKMPLQVACAPRNPLLRRRSFSLEDLRTRSWVLPPQGSQTRSAFDQAFIQAGSTPPLPAVESISFFSNFKIVADSDLLTLAPRMAIARYQEMRVVRGITLEWPIPLSPLLFICRRERMKVDAIIRFRSTMIEAARDVNATLNK